ncbi:MAG: hypothetical protein A4E73_01620 [Syntrophaceae bacterium PtaU1.Bin231]|nr:MAG: hypothetical protein A4E73_01620 [Syntrophaceae bacterium PtaU1.Bin231]
MAASAFQGKRNQTIPMQPAMTADAAAVLPSEGRKALPRKGPIRRLSTTARIATLAAEAIDVARASPPWRRGIIRITLAATLTTRATAAARIGSFVSCRA